jgi:SAM-dependent methyltransferase
MTNSSLYGHDLSEIHDAGFGMLAENAAEAAMKLLPGKGKRIVDLGCGSGTFAKKMVDQGHDVLGIDASRSMICIAKKKVPRGAFRCSSLYTAILPPCDLVTAIGECFNYVGADEHTLEDIQQVFVRIHNALKPGGYFLFDVAIPGRGTKDWVKNFAEGNGWAILFRAKETQNPPRLHREMTCFRRHGKAYRRTEERHVLRLFSEKDILSTLKACGFRNVKRVESYGKQQLFPGLTGFLGQR